jgi:hypothetical protein
MSSENDTQPQQRSRRPPPDIPEIGTGCTIPKQGLEKIGGPTAFEDFLKQRTIAKAYQGSTAHAGNPEQWLLPFASPPACPSPDNRRLKMCQCPSFCFPCAADTNPCGSLLTQNPMTRNKANEGLMLELAAEYVPTQGARELAMKRNALAQAMGITAFEREVVDEKFLAKIKTPDVRHEVSPAGGGGSQELSPRLSTVLQPANTFFAVAFAPPSQPEQQCQNILLAMAVTAGGAGTAARTSAGQSARSRVRVAGRTH